MTKYKYHADVKYRKTGYPDDHTESSSETYYCEATTYGDAYNKIMEQFDYDDKNNSGDVIRDIDHLFYLMTSMRLFRDEKVLSD